MGSGLTLARHVGERVIITVPPSDKPTTIAVLVVGLWGGQARLAFKAPRETAVHREEVQAERDGGDYEDTKRKARERRERPR